MKNKNVKIGMKVMPFQKTAYWDGLDSSNAWNRAKNSNQPYLYVKEWDYDRGYWVLNDTIDDNHGGDFFNSCDFSPYKEEIKGKLKRINYIFNEEEYQIGLSTPLVDINNKPLYTGDVVSLEDCEDSIVCTERGDIMGIWGGKQESIKEYEVRKIKSYKELKNGEIYRDCLEVKLEELNKKESKIVKESKLQKQLREVEKQAETLRKKIKTQENEKNINENIAEYKVERTEIIKGTQYISKDKLKLKLEDTKTSKYEITYIREGYKIICEFSNDAIVGTGVAKCNPDDEFDYHKGIIIAESRARSDFYNKIAEKHIND